MAAAAGQIAAGPAALRNDVFGAGERAMTMEKGVADDVFGCGIFIFLIPR
jgi:hypothetical protein